MGAKLLARRKQVAETSANSDDCPHALNSSLICLLLEILYTDNSKAGLVSPLVHCACKSKLEEEITA